MWVSVPSHWRPIQSRCITHEQKRWLQIRQFHVQGDSVDQEYVLGLYAGNQSDVDALQRETGPTGVTKAYVREVIPLSRPP